jgi:hypothetical protein
VEEAPAQLTAPPVQLAAPEVAPAVDGHAIASVVCALPPHAQLVFRSLLPDMFAKLAAAEHPASSEYVQSCLAALAGAAAAAPPQQQQQQQQRAALAVSGVQRCEAVLQQLTTAPGCPPLPPTLNITQRGELSSVQRTLRAAAGAAPPRLHAFALLPGDGADAAALDALGREYLAVRGRAGVVEGAPLLPAGATLFVLPPALPWLPQLLGVPPCAHAVAVLLLPA